MINAEKIFMGFLKLRNECLNRFLGGGLEKGIITNVYGPPGVGKTNFMLEFAISSILSGKKVIFIDTERNFSPERFLQMHNVEDDLEKIILYEVNDFEEQHNVIKKIMSQDLIKNLEAGILIIDSIVALYRVKIREENINEINAKLSEEFIILAKIAKKYDIPVAVTNQVYSQFDTNKLELVGRDIPKYSSKCLINLKKESNNYRKATIIKHRFIKEGKSIIFEITDKGIVCLNNENKGNRIFAIFK